MAEPFDYGKRNLDWIRTLHWPLGEEEYPMESMEQVKVWAQEKWPGISYDETVIRVAQLPAFEAAPKRLQGEVFSDLNKLLKKKERNG